MGYRDLTAEQRFVAVHTDMLRNPNFCILGGVSQVGKVIIDNSLPTAGTDGVDVVYNPAFIGDMSRKQLRYLACHENGHKMLRHCTEYKTLKKKHPREFAMAVDYVVNNAIESLDEKFGTPDAFLERPTNVPPLIDPKYADMSVPEVVRDLLQNKPQGQQQQSSTGQGKPGQGAFDEHMDPPEELTEAEMEKVEQDIRDAVLQGEIVQGQLRGAMGSPNRLLSGFREQRTDWRGPLRRFIAEICEGDEQSRFNPPNKRFLAHDIVMPSHFSESADEMLIACDTSGSMGGIYPIVFGEIANIAKTVLPKRIRMLWWDTEVAGEQVFEPKDYDNIRNAMHPKGGGGTTVSCVAAYVKAKGYKPKVTIYLSDGYIESNYDVVPGNVLWGIVGNRSFVPLRGKALHIEET